MACILNTLYIGVWDMYTCCVYHDVVVFCHFIYEAASLVSMKWKFSVLLDGKKYIYAPVKSLSPFIEADSSMIVSETGMPRGPVTFSAWGKTTITLLSRPCQTPAS